MAKKGIGPVGAAEKNLSCVEGDGTFGAFYGYTRALYLSNGDILLSGPDQWHTTPVDRLGIPSIGMVDGPHGVRIDVAYGRSLNPATSFPTGVSFASTWDPELISRVGMALAEETRALGCEILLGPCINIVRTPIAGRNFEAYGEDPYLAGRIGVAYVNGVQSAGVGVSLKHFAANNQEIERFRGSSEVDERTLREIYLPHFEAVVKEAKPWTVMCSYNRINGVYASQNHHLLTEILKDEWGFTGVVVSDWTANHTTTESVKGGLDLEMPGPPRWYGSLLVEAAQIWQIEEGQIDEAVRRVLRMVLRSGKADVAPEFVLASPGFGGERHDGDSVVLPFQIFQRLAQLVTGETVTLGSNDDVVATGRGQEVE